MVGLDAFNSFVYLLSKLDLSAVLARVTHGGGNEAPFKFKDAIIQHLAPLRVEGRPQEVHPFLFIQPAVPLEGNGACKPLKICRINEPEAPALLTSPYGLPGDRLQEISIEVLD